MATVGVVLCDPGGGSVVRGLRPLPCHVLEVGQLTSLESCVCYAVQLNGEPRCPPLHELFVTPLLNRRLGRNSVAPAPRLCRQGSQAYRNHPEGYV